MSQIRVRKAGPLVGFLLFALLFAASPAEAARHEREALLEVKAPHLVRHGVPWVVVRTEGRPKSFKAHLNGRDVTTALLRLDGKPRKATLSPSDGLRRGRNVLTVEAGRGRAEDRDRKVIIVRSGVLPAAGRDRTVAPGARLRLDATDSIPDRSGSLRFRWRIVEKPKGSRARLRGRHSAHPRLRTDRRGIYRIDLEVRRARPRGATASVSARRPLRSLTAARDKVEVEATVTPPIGLPVATLQQREGVYGVTVGETFYASPESSESSIQVLRFQRSTLELESNQSLPLGLPISEMREIVCGLQGAVVIQVPPAIAAQFAESYAEELFCVPQQLESEYAAGISLVRAGSEAVNWRGPIEGYLQQNAATTLAPKNDTPVISNWYRFVPGQYVSYESQAPNPPANGNTIAIGGPEQPVAPVADTKQLPAGASGFHAVALDGQSLQILGSAAFATTGGPNDAAGISELAAWLGSYQVQPNARVIVQSIGSPNAAASPSPTVWAEAAQLIEEMGGNSHIFNTVNGSYAFYGGEGMGPDEVSSAVEQSSSATGKPAALTGVLSRDDLYNYAPRLTDPGGRFDTRLMTIAYQETAPWPHPDGSAGEQAAAKWILEHRLKGAELGSIEELRQDYWNDGTFVRDIEGYSGKLQCETVPNEPGFKAAEFSAVCEELEDEFEWVATVTTLLGPPGSFSYGEMQEVLVANNSYQVTSDITENITKQLANYDPGSGEEVADIFGFVSDLAWVGEELTPVDNINAFGLFASVMAIGSDSASAASGEAADGLIQEKADQLASAFVSNTATTVLQFNKLAGIIVSDYGKLKEVGKLAGPNGPWKWNDQNAIPYANAYAAGAVRWAYRELLPAKYEGRILVPNPEAGDEPNTPPREYRCVSLANERQVEYPLAFPKAPEQSYFDHYAAPGQPDAYWILLDGDGEPPSAALAEALQSSPTELFLPWLFEELPVREYRTSRCEGE